MNVEKTEQFANEIAELLPNCKVKTIGDYSASATLPKGGKIIVSGNYDGTTYSIIVESALVANRYTLRTLALAIDDA